MKLSNGAVKALTAGALSGDDEVSAITQDGQRCDCGPILAEKDGLISSKQIEYDNEFHPNLMIKEACWFPSIQFGVHRKGWKVTDEEDGSTEMWMLPTNRNLSVAKHFSKKWGTSGSQCKLGMGKKFTLLDYTTEVVPAGRQFDVDTPVIRVERIRCAPKQKKQTNLKSYFSKPHEKNLLSFCKASDVKYEPESNEDPDSNADDHSVNY